MNTPSQYAPKCIVCGQRTVCEVCKRVEREIAKKQEG